MKWDNRTMRFTLAIAAIASFAIVILFRYGILASQAGGTGPQIPETGERGTISDRNGRVLAMDSPLYNIAIWRPETDQEAFPVEAPRLAEFLGMESEDILARWKSGSSNFFYLKKRVVPQLARAIQGAKADGAFSGVVVEKVAGRFYPEKRLGSHLVGFVGDANRGLAGIELKYDGDLRPPRSRPGDKATLGNSIILTIDANLQFALEEVARKAQASTKAQAVILLAGDARNGEILAYVAIPDFDPNEYFSFPDTAWYDWAAVSHYEPGSVFKVFSMASALDLGAIDRTTSFICGGAYRRTTPGGETITIKCLSDHGQVNITGILEYSCNSGAGQAADRAASVDFYNKLIDFGFGERSGVTLPSESPGSLRSPEGWSLRSKPTIAMGQEIFVTATQMLSAATAIADGGLLLKPTVVRSVLKPDGATAWEFQPTVVRRTISKETAKTILAAMEAGSGIKGTGYRAKVDDIRMAVKTGTAQMIDQTSKRYSDTDFIASTLAIFPVEDPRIVLYGAIVKPEGETFGGRIAAPMIREAAEAILEQQDILRGNSQVIRHSGTINLPRLSPVALGSTMPDLIGTPKKLLLGLLSRDDLRVTIEGDGYVVRQAPEPGSPVESGMEIMLELK
ncbi:MAG: penicillin-binding protein [Rectinemataceae bacterium]